MSLENQNLTAVQTPISIPQIRAAVKGTVITPDDAAYDAARTVFYGGIDKRPAVIVRVADANDVAYLVSLARETGVELAIRSGGHSAAGYSVSEGGIVLDLSHMKALEIDPVQRTIWAETGLTAAEVITAADKHNLAISFGDTGSVGIGGITLCGGVGFLARKFGLTIDDVLAAEIVTANGQLLRVDSQSHPDLFWAIRGGGGNFGVVTRFQYRLHELGTVVGGNLFLPATPEIIREFIALAEAAPEELTTIANVMPAPPMPFLPEEAHGKMIIWAMMLYAGDPEAGERALAPFRVLATPIADQVRPMRYHEMYPPEEGEFHPLAAARSMFIDTVDQNTAQTIVDHLQTSTAMMGVTQLRVLGGAVARVPADATAYAHRQRRIMVNLAALYGNPDEASVHEAWVTDFAAALAQGAPDVYANFLGNEGAVRVRNAYPGATWDRLQTVKQRYDPTNIFRLNQNVTPAQG